MFSVPQARYSERVVSLMGNVRYNIVTFRWSPELWDFIVLKLDNPWVIAPGVEPTINPAEVPWFEYDKLGTDPTVHRGEISFWSNDRPPRQADWEMDPEEEEAREPDVTLQAWRIVSVEPVQIGVDATTMRRRVLKYRLHFADQREQFTAPRGGLLCVGKVNEKGAKPDTLLSFAGAVRLCLDTMGILDRTDIATATVQDLSQPTGTRTVSTLDVIDPPKELQWDAAHAPTELGKLLDDGGLFFHVRANGWFAIDRMGSGSPPQIPDGLALPEVKIPFFDRRGKVVIFSSAPYPILEKAEIVGPAAGTLDFVVQDIFVGNLKVEWKPWSAEVQKLLQKVADQQTELDKDTLATALDAATLAAVATRLGMTTEAAGKLTVAELRARTMTFPPELSGTKYDLDHKLIRDLGLSMEAKQKIAEAMTMPTVIVKGVSPEPIPGRGVSVDELETMTLIAAKAQLGRVVERMDMVRRWVPISEASFFQFRSALSFVRTDFQEIAPVWVPGKERIFVNSEMLQQCYRSLRISDESRKYSPILRRFPKDIPLGFDMKQVDGGIQVTARVAVMDDDGRWWNKWTKVPVVALIQGNVIVVDTPLLGVTEEGTRTPKECARELEEGDIRIRMWTHCRVKNESADTSRLEIQPEYFEIGLMREGGAIRRLTDLELATAKKLNRDVVMVSNCGLGPVRLDGQIVNDTAMEARARQLVGLYLANGATQPRVQEAIGFVPGDLSGLVTEIVYNQKGPVTSFKREAWFMPGVGVASLGSGSWRGKGPNQSLR